MEKYVVGIGATNVDIYCKSKIEIKEHYDHPSDISYTPGGVTRNILENIHKLGLDTKLLTCVGDDIYGNYLIERINESGIDTSNIDVINGGHTGLFVQVQDNNNDMHLAMCDMNILKHIDVDYIKKNETVFKNASAIILDPSLDNEVLNYLFDTYYQRFIRWISDTIGSCNLILINSYNESNNRLALINEKTLKQY